MAGSPSLNVRPFDIQNISMMTSIKQNFFSEGFDRVTGMLRQEAESSYRCSDYLLGINNTTNLDMSINDRFLDVQSRMLMCKWCYDIVDYCNYQREVVAIAFSHVDRYLGTKQGKSALYDKQLYQLVVITALYLAVKTNESVILKSDDFVKLSRGAYSREDIEEMELRILNALNWKLYRPTPQCFLHQLSSIVMMPEVFADPGIKHSILSNAHHKVEAALFDYNSSIKQLPSEIAFTAIVSAIMEQNENSIAWETKKCCIHAMESIIGIYVDDAFDLLSLSHTASPIARVSASAVEHAAKKMKNERVTHSGHPVSPASVVMNRKLGQCC